MLLIPTSRNFVQDFVGPTAIRAEKVMKAKDVERSNHPLHSDTSTEQYSSLGFTVSLLCLCLSGRNIRETHYFSGYHQSVRGIWEFVFFARGLTLMHCRPADLWDQVKAQELNISFSDSSERNPLRSVPAAATRTDVSSALRGLWVFAQEFYIDSITDLVDSTLSFVERYRVSLESSVVSLCLAISRLPKKCSTSSRWLTKIYSSYLTYAAHNSVLKLRPIVASHITCPAAGNANAGKLSVPL
ncbi:hypothetical protein PI124_g20185 [Phytophthora idaei]|nr:hypothetical protein PI125_g24346 [Phytophthora idaei]KAG3138096.1 hypothetical protein PI126_g17072 [Phytophthora idaei]KAG3234767.1 hypothetical protein PI124_g20185 [Phytophthora idaei]